MYMRLAAAVGAVLCLATPAAQAASLQWTFENATLSDASAVTGSFTFDAATDTVGNVQIAVGTGPLHSAASLTNGYNSGNPPTPAADFTFGPAAPGALNLSIIAPFLTDAGGTVSLVQGAGALANCEFASGGVCTQQIVLAPGVQIGFLSGDLRASTVPVPGSAWLLGSALVGLAGFSRRNTVA